MAKDTTKTATSDGPELVADNKHLTAAAPGAGGIDPQPGLGMPNSTDPSNQLSGGGSGDHAVLTPAHIAGMHPIDKLSLYVSKIVGGSPDERVVFGHSEVTITFGDLRKIVEEYGD